MGAAIRELPTIIENARVTKRTPRASIGLPVYNGERYLARALDSILAQDFGDFELIISDNASTDATQEICRDYAERDDRVRYFRHERNVGAAQNFNHACKLSSGDFFRWVAYREWWAPEYLTRCVEIMERKPSVVLVSCPITYYHEEGDMRGSEHDFHDYAETRTRAHGVTSIEAHERFHQMLWCTTGKYTKKSWIDPIYCFIRAKALRKTGLLCNSLKADQVFGLPLSLLGPFWHIPKPLVFRMRAPARTEYQALKRIDPGYQSDIAFPHWRQFYESLRVIKRARLTSRQKVYLIFDLFWFYATWNRDGLMADLSTAIKQFMHPSHVNDNK